MSRVLAQALLVVTSLMAGQAAGRTQVLLAVHQDEYPEADRHEASRVASARRASLMAAWLAENPVRPEALDSLLEWPDLHHAMRHVPRLAEQSPATLAAAMRSLWQRIDRIVFDGEPYGYREVVLAEMPRIRARLATLPHETAAPIVHHVLLIDHRLSRRSDEEWLNTLARFVDEYRGSEASLLAEVDLITAQWSDIPGAVPRLEAFLRAHPGSVAAAKALYSIGFQLATRHVSPAEARGGNHPLVRLGRVADIVKELESGRYPHCEWTAKAAQLMDDARGRLERAKLPAEPAQVRLGRAELDAAQTSRGPAAKSQLESVAVEASGAVPRALATLASQAFVARDYPRARTAFETYLARYPDRAWSWLAAIHLGETLEALGDPPAAASAYRHPAIAEAGDPVVRALASARAAAALDRIEQFEDALAAYRRALDAAEMGGLPMHSPEFRQGALIQRVEQLEQARRVERGVLVERGRLALSQGRLADAAGHLEAFLAASSSDSLVSSAARALLHRARLGQALVLATPGHPQRDDDAAMQILDRLVREPDDFEVGAAAVARAALLHKAGRVGEAAEAMSAALERLAATQASAPVDAAAATIQDDTAAIEATLLRPVQVIPGLPADRLRTETRRLPAVLIVIDRQVRLATGEEVTVRVRREHPGVRWVLPVTPDEYRLLARVINTAGRNKPSEQAMLAGAPDPDDGPPFWDRFFPPSDRPLCELCPVIFDIEFVDAARTRALVRAAEAGSGVARLLMAQRDGHWSVVRVSDISMMHD